MRRRPARLWLLALLAAGAAAFAVVQLGASGGTEPSAASGGPAGEVLRVVRVVDGDTIVVDQDGAQVRVRLLGIDTPETVKPDSPVECFGPDASARAHELLDGQSVLLENDPTQDAVDAYGRTLAYVWVGDALVNEVLVAEGYAREYTYDTPGIHHQELVDAQDAAEANGLGLWSPDMCDGTT